MPGLGKVDWRAIVDTLYQVGFDGVLSVEHEDPVWSGDTSRVLGGLAISLRHPAPLDPALNRRLSPTRRRASAVTFLLRRLGFYLVTAWVAHHGQLLHPPPHARQPCRARVQPHSSLDIARRPARFQRSPSASDTHESLIGQYFGYLSQTLHGNLGISIYFFPSTVTSVISTALPWTLALVGVATVLSFVFGTLLGIVAATRRGTWVDSLLPITSFLSAVPYFWLGLVVLTIFAVKLNWFPLSSGYDPRLRSASPGPSSRAPSFTPSCPATTIIISSIAGWLLGMRNVMMSTLGEDYVLLAEAKGSAPPQSHLHLRGEKRHPAEHGRLRPLSRIHSERGDPDRSRLFVSRASDMSSSRP